LLIGNAAERDRQWSFGRLLDWHFIHGTRHGDVGKPWTTKTFANAVGRGDRY
jgi:hypothetical protein